MSFFFIIDCFFSKNIQAFCFDEAGRKYGIDPLLLKAISITESQLDPKAINHNKNRLGKTVSSDYGLMQINSYNISKLIKDGVISSKDELINKPCLNVQVGAWVLASSFKICGVNWICLGSYNAGFKKNEEKEIKRNNYANKVYANYRKLLQIERG
ncbi:lytic transglycosylase domain-containing protein [Xenorhabdus nematophila]|uniref:lytic transglycosylase domain-containing protein n=1 Tax=Xenorhabdus nematophila TaxID=628 RepID=UPI0032B8736E